MAKGNMYTDKAPKEEKKGPPLPRPSASVLLISPDNQVLLLQRVKTSTMFSSAHVFPGGNADAKHDGAIPAPDAADRHEDGPVYRLAAIRETFEESGLLLAKNASGSLLQLSDEERNEARKKIYTGEYKFVDWVKSKGGKPDTEGLVPFTRWITPVNAPKRFTTQMYLYFLPVTGVSQSSTGGSTIPIPSDSDEETVIPVPTHDGGVEHTAARFHPPSTWLSLANQNRVILFPPQYYLIHLIAPFLSPPGHSKSTKLPPQELTRRREQLLEFLNDPKVEPSWAKKCISPEVIMSSKKFKKAVMDLNNPGDVLQGSDRKGDFERFVLCSFGKGGPRDVEVRWRTDVLEAEKEFESKGKL